MEDQVTVMTFYQFEHSANTVDELRLRITEHPFTREGVEGLFASRNYNIKLLFADDYEKGVASSWDSGEVDGLFPGLGVYVNVKDDQQNLQRCLVHELMHSYWRVSGLSGEIMEKVLLHEDDCIIQNDPSFARALWLYVWSLNNRRGKPVKTLIYFEELL